MGWSESRDRSLLQATEWAEKTIKFEGTNGMAHMVVAGTHLMNRRHDEALDICYEALDLRPNCPIANINFASILHYCGRSAEAVAKVNPPPWLRLHIPSRPASIWGWEHKKSNPRRQSIYPPPLTGNYATTSANTPSGGARRSTATTCNNTSLPNRSPI